ncbi:beta-N-acetylhexosaminidase [Saccharomonospora cyanea]|uniref:beta-N-acetylhexosaminidase n=1 Tax=Saccharomonospora cyanea NA-134 TaxID=882082 RepID=H5XM72_9PSEU|nr:beta-N-acetylhexosaminidase [Saccharomonospora cyanea]EHR63151.1 N-acetyl-beta-hexosaminidase [Saccharomonospora cyanea NA-134]
MRRRRTRAVLTAAVAFAAALSVSTATNATADPAVTGAAPPAKSAQSSLTDIIPAPVEVAPDGDADYRLRPWTLIRTEPHSAEAREVGRLLADSLRPATGYALPVVPAHGRGGGIALLIDDVGEELGSEGYRLEVTKRGVTIRANTAAGLFAGTQTLRQLLPADIEADSRRNVAWTVPGGTVVDHPRFDYRGAMLDIARHFHTPDEIKSYIDELARYKINHLHLHLTDDQGWRIEIESWPKLTTVGGGPGTGVDGVGGGFLTKEEYSDIVAYAAERYITVVPEIDMPGHTNAALSTYAELNCDGIAPPPRTDIAVGYSSLCIDKELTYEFVEDVIREVSELTPGPYLHIGGDEAHVTPPEDYRVFMQRVVPLVEKYGKRPFGWNEIVRAEPTTDTVAQYWGTTTNHADLADAVARGHQVIMSPANKVYLDMKYDEDTTLGLSWAGYIEVRDSYEWNPGAHVTGVGEDAVLGVEAPLWSETLRSLDHIEYMAFPRLAAVAEIGWSPQEARDWTSFSERLGKQAPRWEEREVDFHRSPQVPWVN